MSYSQEIYDAVRSRISNGDVGAAIRDVAWQALDIGHAKAMLQEQIASVGYEMMRPSVLFRPTLSADGRAWCALLGDDLQVGVAGFGDTPAAAMAAFDSAFWNERTPASGSDETATQAQPVGQEPGAGTADAQTSEQPS